MHILEKETILKINSALASLYYKEWVDYFEKVLKATRDKRNRFNRKKLLAIQLKLAETETMLWKMIREGRSRAKKIHKTKSIQRLTEKELKELQGLENHIFINEQLIRILKTICDGIAWRNLHYDRTFLNSSARGFGAGDVNADSRSFKSEFQWAYRISETFNSVVLLNDLTHFLRVGDLTEIGDAGVFLHEIKKFGKDIKNLFTLQRNKKCNKISYQAKRLLELQKVAFSGRVLVNGLDIRSEMFNVKLKTNFKKLHFLLKKSENELVISEKIESCITLNITNFNAISVAGKDVDFEKLKSKLTLPSSTTLHLPNSNWDAFYSDEKGNFLRALIPYSIFPLTSKQCMNLISGYYLVDCILDIEKLKEILESHNWIVEMVTEEELDQQLRSYEVVEKTIFSVKNSLYELAPDEIGLLKIKRGAFSVNLTPNFYSRLTIEFMTLETFLEMLEEMYHIASNKKRSDIYFPVLKNEVDVWN